jgi:hypothetical protein
MKGVDIENLKKTISKQKEEIEEKTKLFQNIKS